MGDSDDEYDRKRRDKFRGERGEASYRGTERTVRPRDDWQERDAWTRSRARDYGRGVRDRGYSPSLEPPSKRLRHDYYGEGYYNHYPSYHQPPHRAGNFFREPQAPPSDSQQPPMMSFKAFLATQDDNISDSEAIEKYNDYKLEFQRQQLNEFFVAHKDDEWFRLKYHPEDSVKRKEEQMAALKKRVTVFMDLLNSEKLSTISIDYSRTNDLLKVLDTVVVKLEGGTDEDLAILEQEYSELEKKEQKPEEIPEKKEEVQPGKEDGEIESAENNKVELIDDNDGEIKENGDEKEQENKDEEKMEVVESEHVDEEKGKVDEGEKEFVEKDEEENPPEETPKPAEPEQQEEKKEKRRKRSYSGSSSSESSSSSSDSEDEKVEKPKEKSIEKEEVIKEKEEEEEEPKIEVVPDDPKPEKPRSLHKTTSIFLRNLAPTITRQEVEAMCSRYDGFLRVALADPQPDRRWLRRGWVTFKRDANIKEICWNLNNIRLRDCELGAIVNRDLSRRIRPINGITAHKQVVRSDIRISARVALHLDNKVGLWLDDDEKKEKNQPSFGLVSNNPVLHNITDYLIEEASAEEEELLGLEPSADNQDSTSTVDRDDTLISVLDRIIMYLRVVHSVDYYNHCEYPNEDEMPNRCGILHARGPPPTAKTDITQFIGLPIETKMAPFLPEKQCKEDNKNDTKLISLSMKDVDTEIDKFVQANTRELAKDKWLCPLSGKKFKGPDYVRKHIFNKHAEKIDEVRKEVEFFNNYLQDAKRPMLAEPTAPKREEQPAYNHPSSYGGGTYGSYGPPRYYNQGYANRPRGYSARSRGGGGGGGGGGDYRPVIHYRDLDAPREPEEFI
ncbi:serrate RNA effector molecule homolog isoform X2 [Onthophagus taurus]|uniref:serrate RNA effector molecule homolog isoform X2 n=1 Tax=Onthophagus taurus TaxID=166361 RepID=UPI000C1FEB43|nr:serrate RNA effector molecule homolog isoform X2 [Onthophagus taurus]